MSYYLIRVLHIEYIANIISKSAITVYLDLCILNNLNNILLSNYMQTAYNSIIPTNQVYYIYI